MQASDRLLTLPNGQVSDDRANKATILGNHATFAYTGLSRCSIAERTDALLVRCFAEPGVPILIQLDNLGKEAARAIRGLPLHSMRPSESRVIRRTSFVGAGYLGIKNPIRLRRLPSADNLHPFLAVVSNAQGITEEWRSEADQGFSVSLKLLEQDELFGLHAAGQPFEGADRVELERDVKRCLGRITRPEPVARLLTRAIRRAASRNARVGPNVMCTMVRRDRVFAATGTFTSGLIPASSGRPEAEYFRWASDGPPGQWIYCPAGREEFIYNTPNYVHPGFGYGMRFEPQPGK